MEKHLKKARLRDIELKQWKMIYLKYCIVGVDEAD